MSFNGYYVKIGTCKFNGERVNNIPTPIMKREGFKILPKLVIVTDDKRTASGKLYIFPPFYHSINFIVSTCNIL